MKSRYLDQQTFIGGTDFFDLHTEIWREANAAVGKIFLTLLVFREWRFR